MRHVTLICDLENIISRTPCKALLSDRGDYEEHIKIESPRRALEVKRGKN
jgi:hypothetical protein